MANEFTIHLQHHFFPVFGVSLRMAISFPSFGIGGRILLLGILRFFEKHMKEFEPPECTFLPEGPMLMAFTFQPSGIPRTSRSMALDRLYLQARCRIMFNPQWKQHIQRC